MKGRIQTGLATIYKWAIFTVKTINCSIIFLVMHGLYCTSDKMSCHECECVTLAYHHPLPILVSEFDDTLPINLYDY